MAIGGVVINFAVKATEAVRDLDLLSRAVKDVGTESDRADTKMGRLKDGLKKGVAVGAAAAGAALTTAGAALVKFGANAIEDAERAGRLADTLARIPGVTRDAIRENEKWIESMRIATGVAKDELSQGVADLTIATGSLQEAQDLSALAWDVAVGTGKGYEEILEALVEGTKGETGALTEQVQWLKTADGRTLTLKDAVKQLDKAYGGAAEAANNRRPFERLKAIWDEMEEALGQAVMPAVEKFSDWFKSEKNQRAVQKLIDRMGDLASEAGDKVVPAIEDFLGYVSGEKFSEDMEDFASDVKAIWGALKLLVNIIGAAINGLKGLWRWFENAVAAWDRFLDRVDRGITWPWEKGRSSGGGVFRSGVTGTPAAMYGPAGTGVGRMFTGPITLNVTGAGDPVATARIIKRALEGYDATQGRAPGTRLAVAW